MASRDEMAQMARQQAEVQTLPMGPKEGMVAPLEVARMALMAVLEGIYVSYWMKTAHIFLCASHGTSEEV